jgi:protein tyrosine phosphatase (PTP) superfamily phosphohydrolase (DUF442 family)
MSRLLMVVAVIVIATSALAAEEQRKDRARLDKIEQSLKSDVPRVLCLDGSFATGGQPSEQAFAKVAANGFHSVLSLRTPDEGIDLKKERASVEKTGLRYFNIPVVSSAPRTEQADEFLRLVREESNHPMLINCATANRVGAFMMIYRVVGQGWSEEKALDEALKIGLRGEELKKFAQSYIAQNKAKRG